ncbi:MAG: Uracil permease [Eubacteriales bacterium SKADARSKE-1]|nr:Uracil permease [Eubacteriales bacterium SKADARSKE-1]
MFGASVLVPMLFGINASVVLFMNGVGTLIFFLVTKGKCPAFLGSSFAFITPTLIILSCPELGFQYALGGFVASGVAICIFALIIKLCGIKWIDILLPPAVMGPIVALIGLELADVAANQAGLLPLDGNFDFKKIIVFIVTLLTALLATMVFKGFFSVISILISIIVGYSLSIFMGIVDFVPVIEAPLFNVPNFQLPKFEINSILIILPAVLVVISEHIGHQIVTSKIIDRDLTRNPGLHRSLLGDGIATIFSGLAGSVPTTTYGENIGVMAITKVYSVWVIGGAAIISIIIAFIGKVPAMIQTIPNPVMGGIGFLLYGMIATSGIRLLVEAKVNYAKSRNLILTSIVFIAGLSKAYISIGEVRLTGMVLATMLGIVLSLILFILDKLNLTNDKEEENRIS